MRGSATPETLQKEATPALSLEGPPPALGSRTEKYISRIEKTEWPFNQCWMHLSKGERKASCATAKRERLGVPF
jgi:hypothetical protein